MAVRAEVRCPSCKKLFFVSPCHFYKGRTIFCPSDGTVFALDGGARPIPLDDAWMTSTVRDIAKAIIAEDAFDRLPILADALEDAGCTNRAILDHCRQPGEHVRGCWVVDLVLGKEQVGSRAVGAGTPVPFSDAVRLAQAQFGSSAILAKLGYSKRICELVAEKDHLSQYYHWVLAPYQERRLLIRLCESSKGDHYFIVEIRRVDAEGAFEEAFLLDDWMWAQGMTLIPYPFILSSYTGAAPERMAGFVAFFEAALAMDAIVSILCGKNWPAVLDEDQNLR